MEIKKTTLYFFGILILIIFGIIFTLSNNSSNQEKIIPAGSGEIQEVVIGMKNFNYYPNTFTVDSGKTVRISLDKSVAGCFRSFTIRQLGINKYLASDKDYVEFVAPKPGTYAFACSMGMGTGKMIVK